MTEPKFLPQVKQINALPISQTCLEVLEQLKEWVDHQELYCLQLLKWGEKKGILELEPDLEGIVDRYLDQEPRKVAYLLRLESYKAVENPDAENVANLLAAEIQDRANGLTPEEADE